MFSPLPAIPSASATPLVPAATSGAAGAGSTSFGDIVDALNPLQHIPVVSSLYRAVTGNSISTGAQMAGDLAYGAALGTGIIGVASTLANGAVKTLFGNDVAGSAVTGLTHMLQPTTATSQAVALVPNNLDSSTPTSASLPLPTRGSARQAAQYQRAQTFDALNKRLVTIMG